MPSLVDYGERHTLKTLTREAQSLAPIAIGFPTARTIMIQGGSAATRSSLGSLSGKVAVVTGASRGIGKGIALALADEGATVYVTGRTVTTGSYPSPGTVGETAAEVDRRGGKGIAVQVDHAERRAGRRTLRAGQARARAVSTSW